MRIFKKFLTVFLSTILAIMPLSVSAQEGQLVSTEKPTVGVESTVDGYGEGVYTVSPLTRDAKLIIRISLTIAQVEGNRIRVNFATGAKATMAKIGGKDITIQRWENNKWVDVASGDMFDEDISFYSGSYYSPTSLPTGYYYRATIKHYAKEQGWFFPASEDFYNETEFILLT